MVETILITAAVLLFGIPIATTHMIWKRRNETSLENFFIACLFCMLSYIICFVNLAIQLQGVV